MKPKTLTIHFETFYCQNGFDKQIKWQQDFTLPVVNAVIEQSIEDKERPLLKSCSNIFTIWHIEESLK